MTQQSIIIFLSIGVIVLNLAAATRAVSLALVLESGCKWVCQTISIYRVIKLLLGFGIICLMLSILKAWSIWDIILFHWDFQPQDYKIRAYAYLGENYGVGMLCWVFTTYVKKQTNCYTSQEFTDLKLKYKRLSSL